MFPFVLSLFLALTGIFICTHYITYVFRKKLPPGPIPLPVIGSMHLLGKLPHRDLYKLSQKYGPIMSLRLGSCEAVVVSSPDAAKLFLGTHDVVFASRPKLQVSEYVAYGTKGMAATPYGPYWQSVRKFCATELLSATKINGFAMMRREEIRLTMEEIRACATKHEVVNLNDKVGKMIENMTIRMLFGRKSDDRFPLSSMIKETSELIGAFNLGDYVPILAPFDLQGLTRRIKSLSKAYDEMFEILIDEHKQSIDTGFKRLDEMDFIDILLSLKSQNLNTHNSLSQEIDRTGMKAILLDMIFGSIDTATSSIEWVMSLLITHPRVMKKLQKELKVVVGNKKVVDEIDLTKLNYLHMVIKESFRLFPTAPLLAPHESTQDVVINGYHIRKKTRLIVNFWAFGRDSKVWSENWNEFLPERFLDKVVDLRGRDFELIPFSSGRRGCPGMNLGLLNIGLVVSHLVHFFNWDLPNGMSPVDLDMDEKFGLTMPRAKPLLAIPTYCV